MSLADRATSGLSPLYDAIQQGLIMMESAHYPNRALIVITYGVDDTSSVRKEDLIDSINLSGVPIYAIEFGEPYARAYPKPQGLALTIPFPRTTASTAPANATRGKTVCANYKCVDTGTLEKLTAPNGGQLLIVPHPLYDPRITLNDELNSTVANLDHGYAIGVVAPVGSIQPEIALAKHPHMRVRAHLIHLSQQ